MSCIRAEITTLENIAIQARITKMFAQGFKGYETVVRYETAVFW